MHNARNIIFALFLLQINIFSFSQETEETDYLFTINTKFGDIKLILFEDTPKHRENFIRLCSAGLFDSTTFYRVIDNFVIQGGNPLTRKNLTEYEKALVRFSTLDSEILEHHKNDFGALGAPTRNPGVDSNAEHFYIVENANGTHHLDGKYTVFGKVMSGLDVVMKIAELETNEKDKPLEKVFLTIQMELVTKKEIEKFYTYKYN